MANIDQEVQKIRLDELQKYRAMLVELEQSGRAIHPEAFDIDLICTIRQSITTLTKILVATIDYVVAQEAVAKEAADHGRRLPGSGSSAAAADS